MTKEETMRVAANTLRYVASILDEATDEGDIPTGEVADPLATPVGLAIYLHYLAEAIAGFEDAIDWMDADERDGDLHRGVLMDIMATAARLYYEISKDRFED